MLMAFAEKLFDVPAAFQAFQGLIGAQNCHRRFLEEHVRPGPHDRLLDLGCGTGISLEFLPPGMDYVGIDINEGYIAYAKRRYGARGTFDLGDAASSNFGVEVPFDRVVAVGVLHHVDDGAARHLVRNAVQALKPGGVFASIDPCYVDGQSRAAKFFIDHDRGRHVRGEERYREIFSGLKVDYVRVASDMMRIPYTQIIARVLA